MNTEIDIVDFDRRIFLLGELLEVFSLRDRINMFSDKYPQEMLNLRLSTVKEEAKVAYRKLVRMTHPDFGGDPDEFIAVKSVYDTLQKFELFPIRVRCSHCNGTGFTEYVPS